MADPIVQVPALDLRLDLGRELLHEEGDSNLKKLRDFCNMLAYWIEGSLNDDGTLKSEAVNAASIIASRIITADKLDLSALNFIQDSGSEDNVYRVQLGSDSETRLAAFPATGSGDSLLIWMYSKRANTGPAFLVVSKTATTFFDQVPIRKRDNIELLPGDIKAEELVCLVYEPTTETFRLISGGAKSASGGTETTTQNFTGLTKYEDTVGTALDGSSSHLISHGLNQTPDRWSVYLRNIVTDAGYDPMEIVDIGTFTDPTGTLPGFTVNVTPSAIVVQELHNPPSVPDQVTGAPTAITLGSWEIFVKAWVYTSVSTVPFPETTFNLWNTGTAWAYNNAIYSFTKMETLANEVFTKINLINRNVTRQALATLDTHRNYYSSGCVYRKDSDGKDYILLINVYGWHSVNLETFATQTFSLNGYYLHFPVWIDEAPTGTGAANSTASPQIYAFAQLQRYSNLNSVALQEIHINGAYYTDVATIGTVDFGDAGITGIADFHSLIGGAAQNPGVSSIQYNRVDTKRRIYLVEHNTKMLHIFNLLSFTSNNIAAWAAAPVYGVGGLAYEKTLILPSVGYDTQNREVSHIFVEFDMETGAEISIVTNSKHDGVETGTTVRTPWQE